MSIEHLRLDHQTWRANRVREILDRSVWPRPDVRIVLANRDIRALYEFLQRYGISQRLIAVMTEQAQSEISDILGRTGRRVTSYDLLVRIAEGLRVPRGWMGLAYDDETARLYIPRPGANDPV
jgi:hypothetical protein